MGSNHSSISVTKQQSKHLFCVASHHYLHISLCYSGAGVCTKGKSNVSVCNIHCVQPLLQMVWLYKDPKGTNIFSSTQNDQQQPSTVLVQFNSSTIDSILSDKSITDSKKIELLAARVRELEANVGLSHAS